MPTLFYGRHGHKRGLQFSCSSLHSCLESGNGVAVLEGLQAQCLKTRQKQDGGKMEVATANQTGMCLNLQDLFGAWGLRKPNSGLLPYCALG